ncbi:YTH domain-containing protein ECT1-like isoform X2 [Phragmites australis]|nr:YTH domain-containing protein ECT1-like isoform X2 [Phragmites australis]XP_062191694.1 YTH domain-containing protein ECT1-like isoform X2 [Phragmites australis]
MIPLQSDVVLENNPSKSSNSKEQILSSTENTTTSNVRGGSSLKSPKGALEKASSVGKGGEQPFLYQHNVYAPQPQALYPGGYMNPSGQWEEYPHYMNMEGLHSVSPGIYNDNQSFMLSPGYANNPQMMYGTYSPVSTVGDGQQYFPMHFPFSSPYYQPPASPSMGYSNSAPGISQGDPMLQQEYFLPDGLLYSPTAGYHQPFSSFDRAPIQQNSTPGLFGQGNVPLASGMHHGSLYGLGSYKARQQGSKFGGTTPSWSSVGRRFGTFDLSANQQRGSMPFGSHNGSLEFMNEQNRGPRATKPKIQDTENSGDEKSEKTVPLIDSQLYNRPDFVTEYKDAKFFVIKSYTEDHVHRSIKYNVWASTASGNRKLDSAYRAAKEKEEHCPIFLFFSVNGSGQFCGVAEMIGPVDFDRSVDYWQQDKWSGQFPVKWHIIKDVPNNLLRHIILENNDNKPVTNSRDTQEVKLEQGLQMLTIFKSHETETTILEDFDFYEQREKALHENRRQQQPARADPQKPADTKAQGLVADISGAFAQAVQLKETENNGKNPKAEGASAGNGSTAIIKVEKGNANSNTGPVEETS